MIESFNATLAPDGTGGVVSAKYVDGSGYYSPTPHQR